MKEKHFWFLGFTAIFAVLAAIVFWGCWSTGVAFISPDDGYYFSASYSETLTRWWNIFSTTGKGHPLDVLWSGLLFSPQFCCELKYLIPPYLSGLALAFFFRGRGLSYLAAFGGGLFLSFCGYWFTLFSAGHGNWFVWMSYGVFAFGLIDRAVERGAVKYWLWLGVMVSWASFYAPDVWLLFTVFTGVYFVFRLISLKVFPWKRMLLALAVFISVGLPSFYDAFTNTLSGRDKQIEESKAPSPSGNKQDDDEARWIFITNWSMPIEDTLEFFNARIQGDTSCPFTLSINAKKGVKPYTGALGRPINAKEGNYRQHSLYVGWVTCLFALAGIISLFFPRYSQPLAANRRPVILFFTIAAVVFWLFSLGRYCEVVYRLVYVLPFGDYLRAPVKWHHLTEFCLCVLAGFGIDFVLRLAKSLKAKPASIFQWVIFGLILVGVFDLAKNAQLYCAPVDYSRAIKAKCSAQLTVLSREQFQHPQVAEMVRRGEIVSVANWLGNPNAYLVQVLQPQKPSRPADPKPIPLTLGIISVLTALGVIVVSMKRTDICKLQSAIDMV